MINLETERKEYKDICFVIYGIQTKEIKIGYYFFQ